MCHITRHSGAAVMDGPPDPQYQLTGADPEPSDGFYDEYRAEFPNYVTDTNTFTYGATDMNEPTTAIDSIEDIISGLEAIDASGPLLASLAWSFAASAAQSFAATTRVHDREDPRYNRLSDDQKAESLQRLEQRIDENLDLLSWAVPQATQAYLPDVRQLVADMATRDVPAGREVIDEAMIAERMGMSEVEMRRAKSRVQAERALDNQKQREALGENFDEIVKRLESAMNRHCPGDMSISDTIAARILNKIADKCEQYVQRRNEQAFQTMRTRRLNKLAAEKQVLNAVMDQADDLLEQIEAAMNASPNYATEAA